MSGSRYLDEFTNNLNESGFSLDTKLKQMVLGKTYKKTRKRWFSIKKLAAACLIIAAILSAIPSTPVYALRQRLFSFIPGVGVVQTDEETGKIKSVLAKPVKVTDGEQFVEVRAAYLVDQTLHVLLKTNVGAVDAGEFKDIREFKQFFSGKTAPDIHLVMGRQKLRPGFLTSGGPSFGTRVYAMEGNFSLSNESDKNESFAIEVEGFNKIIHMQMSPVLTDRVPENMGNMVMIDQVMVFAASSRQGEILEVLLSAVAPQEYKNIRFSLFDWEKKGFKEGVHIVDQEGNVYKPDEELKNQDNGSRNTFYFKIPQDKKGLQIIIPQILYDREYNEGDISINMPEVNKEVPINKEIDLGETLLKIQKASIIPANDPWLPDHFKAFNSLKIEAAAQPKPQSRERIIRIIPEIGVRDGIFGFIKPSSSSFADLWAPEQHGYSVTEFENMANTSKILLNLNVECAMTGPWKISLD